MMGFYRYGDRVQFFDEEDFGIECMCDVLLKDGFALEGFDMSRC